MAFRCAAASLERGEQAVASASTVRAFLLVENPGPWGTEALRDARLPAPVTAALRSSASDAGVRVLLVRRHRRLASAPEVRVFAAYADPVAPWLESATLASVDLLPDLDLPALGAGRSPGLTAAPGPLFCVCTHGRHDACCAERGRPVAAALSGSHPEETWEISHIGGDRFAANVLVLPDGLYYGRVGPDQAASLAERHLSGHLDLDLLRGRSGFGFAVQAAEIALRTSLGETRTGAVRLASVAPRDPTAGQEGTVWVALRAGGTTYVVEVSCSVGDQEHQLTCRAQRRNPVPRYTVTDITQAPG